MRIKGIIFDLDGTLIDSLHCWERADRNFLLENGIEPPPGVSDIMKKLSMREAAQYFIDLGVNMTHEAVTERIEELVFDEYASKVPLKKYALELLDILDNLGIVYCVATANYRSLTDVILKRFGIFDRFRFIYTCAENGIKKDDPSFFSNVGVLLGTSPEETAVLDDSFHCLKNAHDSGFFTAAVFDETTADWDEAVNVSDISVNDLQEFAEYIKKEVDIA